MCSPLKYIVFNFFVVQYVKQYKQVRLICHTLELTLMKHESKHTVMWSWMVLSASSPSPRCAFSFPALLAFTEHILCPRSLRNSPGSRDRQLQAVLEAES